ncbi:MAG: histidine phosphatase family protein [Amaricoccus sp.]
MKTLILMRHAKSSWDDPAEADIDRPLNKRGREDAGKVGRWLRKRGLAPDLALVSTAERTRESWAGVTAELGTCLVDFRPELYHADAPTMLAALRRAEGERVLMLGHNPGIGEFARRLLAEMSTAQGFADYPTAATAVIAFPVGSWAEIGWSSGRLMDFAIPRALG